MNLPPPDLPEPNLPPPAKETALETVEAPVVRDPDNPYAPPLAAVEVGPKEKRDVYAVSESFRGLIREAFAFPLRPSGLGAMVIGIVVMAIMGVAAAPIILAPRLLLPVGAIALPVVLVGCAYLGAYYLEIINRTLNGGDDASPWPGFGHLWDDVLMPGVQMLGILVMSGGVQIAALINAGGDGKGEPFFWLGAVVKWGYLPLATLAVVCHGSVWAALPHRVLPALVRCLPGYLVCAGAFAAAEILQAVFSELLGMIPILGWFLPGVVFMYVMLVQARLTGLIYWRYQERMPW
ncbi:MAG TPA: hypothetical protein VD994_17945 [Prosthecobacter sp.]|nr:hypothetical protein [Prosthecobacter sp.]